MPCRDRALRTDQHVPNDYEIMRTVTCIECATDFNIIHHLSSANPERADQQAEHFKSLLCAEHGDQKDCRHSESYDELIEVTCPQCQAVVNPSTPTSTRTAGLPEDSI